MSDRSAADCDKAFREGVHLTSRSGVLKEARSRVKPGENARREGGLAEQFRVSSFEFRVRALHIRPLALPAKRFKVVPPHPLLLEGLDQRFRRLLEIDESPQRDRLR